MGVWAAPVFTLLRPVGVSQDSEYLKRENADTRKKQVCVCVCLFYKRTHLFSLISPSSSLSVSHTHASEREDPIKGAPAKEGMVGGGVGGARGVRV